MNVQKNNIKICIKVERETKNYKRKAENKKKN